MRLSPSTLRMTATASMSTRLKPTSAVLATLGKPAVRDQKTMFVVYMAASAREGYELSPWALVCVGGVLARTLRERCMRSSSMVSGRNATSSVGTQPQYQVASKARSSARTTMSSAVSGHSKLTRPCPPCAPTSRLFFYIIPSYRSATMAALRPNPEIVEDTSMSVPIGTDGLHGNLQLRIIEWRQGKHRAIYYGSDDQHFTYEEDGSDVESQFPYSAYVTWPNLRDQANYLSLGELYSEPTRDVWRAVRTAIREYFAMRRRQRRRSKLTAGRMPESIPTKAHQLPRRKEPSEPFLMSYRVLSVRIFQEGI